MTTTLNRPTESQDPRPSMGPVKKPRKIGRWILFVIMMIVAMIMLYPFWVMIYTSLKSEAQFLAGSGFSWISWSSLTSVIPIGQEVLSSTIVCASSILLILIVGLPAGFAFSKLDSDFRRESSSSWSAR